MKNIKNFEEFEAIKNQDKPVLLDFYADWCGPCQALLPSVEKLSKKYENEFLVRKINIEQFRELAVQFQVRSIPALFVLKDGEIKESTLGYKSEDQLESLFKNHLATA